MEVPLRQAHGISSAAYLRLDTDYFESALIELEVLYLSLGGALIIDDYGHFEGARGAVDEFFSRADMECAQAVGVHAVLVDNTNSLRGESCTSSHSRDLADAARRILA